MLGIWVWGEASKREDPRSGLRPTRNTAAGPKNSNRFGRLQKAAWLCCSSAKAHEGILHRRASPASLLLPARHPAIYQMASSALALFGLPRFSRSAIRLSVKVVYSRAAIASAPSTKFAFGVAKNQVKVIAHQAVGMHRPPVF